MDDLQLLELLEKAKEKQKGPKGDPGVGIDKVEQFDGNSFTLRLTDGSFKKIDLQPGADGEAGAVGPVGAKGDQGVAGRDGGVGATGQNGKDGVPGRDGSFVDTAVVNSSGDLLLSLSTGEIINVGRVVGPAGATGAAGPTGLPGNNGEDGEAVLSGPRAPQSDDGKNGDHWIDISSAEFSFYKKSGDGWSKLANLRQPAKETRVGAGAGGGSGSGGGGGKGEPQNSRTLPLINGGSTIRKKAQARDLPPVPGKMDTQEDANLYFLEAMSRAGVTLSEAVPRPPSVQGQLWFCTAPNDLTLYIYDGSVWVPAAPPVSLDGIEASISNIDEELLKVNANVAMNKSELDEKALDIQLDQDRQDGEIRSLEQEIEGIVPSFDRGVYGFTDKLQDLATANGGYYAIVNRFVTPEEMCNTLLADCQAAAGGDSSAIAQCNRDYSQCMDAVDGEDGDAPIFSTEWREAHSLWIDLWDKQSKLHTFKDAKSGKYIELTNSDGTGNMVALIEEDRIEVEPGISQIKINVLSWKGKPSGDARIKLFEISASDPTDYVRKTGDKMTGQLQIQPTKETTTGFVCYAPDKLPNDNSLSIGAFVNGMGKTIMELKNNGQIWVGDRNFEYTPTKDKSLVNKKYVDEEIAKIEKEEDETNARLFGSPYRFRSHGVPTNLTEGEFTYDKDWNWYAHRYDAAGDRIGISTEDGFTHDGMFKVYRHNGTINLICIMHRYDVCKTGQKNNNYFQWKKKEATYTHSEWLEEGKTYYLSDGFLLP